MKCKICVKKKLKKLDSNFLLNIAISSLCGFGMFCLYILSDINVFFSIIVGGIISSATTLYLTKNGK